MESVCSDSKWKSLYQKLRDVYVEALKKQTTCPNVQPTSNLLAQLISKENLNTLIVNLFPGNEGYSIMLRGRNGIETETVRLPYEETELLDYIDAEKLPPLLVDLLDRAQADLFHSGCVIAEVRDYRRSINNTYSIQYVLLQPSMHTLLCDINAMTSDAPNWTVEDKLALESQLLLHTSEPLCLDPSPGVFLASARLNYEKHKLNTTAFRRCARRCSQVALNRRRKMEMCAAPKHLKLFDFVMHRKNKIKHIPPVNLKLGLKPCVDPWKKTDVQLTTPESIDVQKYAKALDRPKLTGDNSPVVVEEYMFETERSQGRVNVARLVIMQRLSDECYLGSLYVDRDFKDADFKGSTCRFWLGTKANVEKYVRQFREIFTEEGRRLVKITHSIPGRQPTVTYTQVLGSVASTAVPNVTSAAVVVSQASAGVGLQVNASSAGAHVGVVNSSLQQQPAQPRHPSGQSVVAPSSSVLVSSSVTVTTPSPTVVTNLAQLRLSLQQQQQLMRQKSASGLLPISSHLPVNMPASVQLQSNGPIGSAFMSGINAVVVPGSASPGALYVQGGNKTATAPIPGSGQPGSIHIQGSGSGGSVQSTVKSPSGATIQHLASPSLSRDSSMLTASRNSWANQIAATSSLQLSTLNSVVPPNVNIGNIAGLSSNMSLQNVSRLHNANAIQSGSATQRTFIAMVTSQSVFNSPPQGLLSSIDSPFSLSIGNSGQQFVSAGGSLNTGRGTSNDQLLMSRQSMQGINSTPRHPTQMLQQQSPGSIHIQTDMSPVGSQMMSPPSMSPFHSMTAGQSHLVHHQQMTSPVSAVPHQTLAGFQLQGARVVQPSSLMAQLPPSSGGGVSQLINRNRRPSNSKLP